MAEQDANVLEVLIGQMGECRDINPVLSKTLGVLGHAELLEPIGNLLHRRALSALGPAGQKVYHARQLVIVPCGTAVCGA